MNKENSNKVKQNINKKKMSLQIIGLFIIGVLLISSGIYLSLNSEKKQSNNDLDENKTFENEKEDLEGSAPRDEDYDNDQDEETMLLPYNVKSFKIGSCEIKVIDNKTTYDATCSEKSLPYFTSNIDYDENIDIKTTYSNGKSVGSIADNNSTIYYSIIDKDSEEVLITYTINVKLKLETTNITFLIQHRKSWSLMKKNSNVVG